MLRESPQPRRKSLIGPTYKVTIIMLVVGQIQVSVAMEIKPLKDFLAERYYLSLVQFLISFLSIQLYGFFYHLIVKKPMWVRVLAGLWTYEVNTMSIMKPAKRAPYLSLILSIFLTFLMMVISVIYGNKAVKHQRGLFPEQGDPVEREDIRAHLLRHHSVRRDEARCHRVSYPASIHHDLERVRHHLRRLAAKAPFLSPRLARGLYTDRSAVLPQLLRPVHELRVDDGVLSGADGMGRER
ncbi:uncharacterized protein LOC108022898 isoform X2 [Drosophila biarmipes]|uniref:uncharacterized protein LOC108022898 isoform X2 n=1 Tax=Drosophila biarmipes TaxID=125945 RepID=UPI0007E87B94|nr:uncharacterized protein LOC108022898 isoform X2 [Drosophila biarmipes]